MSLLHRILTDPDPGPFALLRREGRAHVEVLVGELATADTLATIPLPSGPGPRTLAVVPYRQVAERGFACVDDHAPLTCLRVRESEEVPLADALALLPDRVVELSGGSFDIGDAEYGRTVEAVLRDEIGRGEGANFVIHRTFTASVAGSPVAAGLAALRRLLVGERGAYWTFLVHTDRTFVGATPERHVSVEDGTVMMNPISGTYRHQPGGPDRDGLLRFLADRKEIDELYMVLDEELKMMADVAELGGQVVGPYLKQMSQLTHTEYLLAGETALDVREVLRRTMFAPTVTGSPIENACRVIARHERRGRGYYAGVLALLGHDASGRQTLDAPILIRTAEIDHAGRLRVPVGATLVRNSTPDGEVAETYAKAAGILAAFGAPAAGAAAVPMAGAPPVADPSLVDAEIQSALAARNEHLARFWLTRRGPGTALPELAGRRILIIDAEDTFTAMLAHQLRALGFEVTLRPYHSCGDATGFDIVVPGPGPGDPGDLGDPKMALLHRLVADLLDRGQPTLAVCLGHQVLCARLGLRLHRRTAPYQGVQQEIDLFGRARRVGFYSTFTALSAADRLDTPYGEVRLARDTVDGAVHALRGPAFAGVQFHPESVLTEDGLEILAELTRGLVGARSAEEVIG
ncbi:MAG: chorismate-binding protein [Micromonosporaceae bacterium]|nr:chorismate-binding protein [Micromonosporaceae bacterium]